MTIEDIRTYAVGKAVEQLPQAPAEAVVEYAGVLSRFIRQGMMK